jgi:Rad3-related DNA helicase
LLGKGYAHAYLYPGLRKVVQAAGRVIRSDTDQGVLWLMDERFAQAQVRALLPTWWHLQVIESPDDPAGPQHRGDHRRR